jgi:hypothetical protein
MLTLLAYCSHGFGVCRSTLIFARVPVREMFVLIDCQADFRESFIFLIEQEHKFPYVCDSLYVSAQESLCSRAS